MEDAQRSTEVISAMLARLAPRSALLVGAVHAATVAAVRGAAIELQQLDRCAPVTAQIDRRFDLVVMHEEARNDPAQWRSFLHCAVQYLEPSGHLLVLHAAGEPWWIGDVEAAELQLVEQRLDDEVGATLFRRGERFNVHDLLFEARAAITRVTPQELFEQLGSDDPPLVLDTRTHTDRERFGVIDRSVHVPRTVVEWHLDPANSYQHRAIRGFDQYVVVVCNAGYSSSLAAANLVRLGFRRVADLVGGINGWSAAGLPLGRPDHSHLDF
jgi:rhodanese-related sulfurtransferase